MVSVPSLRSSTGNDLASESECMSMLGVVGVSLLGVSNTVQHTAFLTLQKFLLAKIQLCQVCSKNLIFSLKNSVRMSINSPREVPLLFLPSPNNFQSHS